MATLDEFEKKQVQDIGTFFAQLRYKRGKTQRDLGFMAGIGQAAVTKFEKAQSDFRFTTLQSMAKVHGYRLELRLVPIEGGESIVVEPDPEYRTTRSYSQKKVVRRAPKKKPVKKEAVLPGPQVQYESDDEFDTEKEMQALRQRLGIT